MRLHDLNQDVLHHILCGLGLDDILSLERVDRKLRNTLGHSKSIWMQLLQQCIAGYDLKLPFSDAEVTDLSASTVKSCLRSAFLVRKNLRKGIPTSTINLAPQLPITWLRSIRSRWIIVASSNDNDSVVSCWDAIPSSGATPAEVSRHRLDGPVVDGEADDGLYGVVIAVTVETWPTKICILSLQNENGTASFLLIREIVRGSHVAALRDEWLAFRVYDGAEEAQLVGWTTGRQSHLDSTTFVGSSPRAKPGLRGPALSIALWRGYVIVVFRWEVHVFSLSDNPILLQSTKLPGPGFRSTGAAMFATGRNYGSLMQSLATRVDINAGALFLFTRDTHRSEFDTQISITAITPSTDESSLRPLVLTSLGSIKDPLIGYRSHEMLLSTTGSTIAWVFCDLIERPLLAMLHLHLRDDMDLTQMKAYPQATVHTTRVDELPFLVPRISMVLDDARGLFVVATIQGDLTIAKFYDCDAWQGLHSSLPPNRINVDVQDTHNNETPLLSNWPQLRADGDDEPIADPKTHEIYTSTWGVPSGIELPDEWITDWDSFDDASEWFPISRRQAHATEVFAGIVTGRLCEEYGVIGIPIPMCRGGRHEGIHDTSVLFRIGRRPYFTRVNEFYIPVGADGRALSIEETLVDPTAAYRRSVDLKEYMAPTDTALVESLWVQRGRAAALEDASRYVSRNPEMSLARSADPSSWSAEEWENLAEGLPSTRSWKL